MSASREPAVHASAGTETGTAAVRLWVTPDEEKDVLLTTSPGAGPQSQQHPWRPKNPLASFQHAFEGVLHTFRTQRNMRFHFFAFVLVLLSGLLCRFSATEMLGLLFSASLVLITEMFNTAVEAVVDMITSSYHPAAKFAKDIAAGAVLIAAVNAVVVGCVLFLRSDRLAAIHYRIAQPPGLYLFVIAGLLLMTVLLAWKALGQKGTLLQGGVISGHSAIAFFFAFTILFVANNTFAAILAVLLALLVAQSRVEARIHTVREVIIGAALALFLTASIYRIPIWVVRYLPGGDRMVPAVDGGALPPAGGAPASLPAPH